MNLATSKSVHNLSILLIVVFFFYILVDSLIEGGRWDLNEQIAFGDRLSSGISTYANGITDLYFPSSPYFPGVGFLSALYQYIGIDNIYVNNQLMLLTAVFIGIVYFILLRKLTIKIYPTIPSIIVTSMLVLFFSTHFSAYIFYMKEFKPDTILLVFATIIFLILEKGSKPKVIELIIIGSILFISVFFKQSFFLVYFIALISIFTNSFLEIKNKIFLLFLYASIGLLALYIVLNINNLIYFSVETMGKHSMLNMKTIIYFFGVGFLKNIIFLIPLIYFMIKNYQNYSLKNIESKYFTFAFVWFIFSAVSTAKSGGNAGNFEVGIIVAIPFVIYTLHNFFKGLYSNIYFYRIIMTILLVLIFAYSYAGIKNTMKLNNTIVNNNVSIKYLTDKFKGKSAFIDGNTYILSKMSGLNIVTEAETLGHFNNVPNYDMYNIKNALKNQKYDLIFVKKIPEYYVDKDINKLMMNNYEILIDTEMPKYLKSKILVRKRK